MNLRCVYEPNGITVVTGKLSTHLQDLDIVHFLNIVAHLHALFVAVGRMHLFFPDKLDFRRATFPVILQWTIQAGHRCVKVDDNRCPDSSLGFYHSLDELDVFFASFAADFLDKLVKMDILRK